LDFVTALYTVQNFFYYTIDTVFFEGDIFTTDRL